MSAYKVVDKYGVGSYLQLERGEGGGVIISPGPIRLTQENCSFRASTYGNVNYCRF